MYNVVQPIVDFTNSNIETLSRFANSREVTELAKPSSCINIHADRQERV
jgi:hypothetical protein